MEKKNKEKKEKQTHNGIPVDSQEEVMVLLWLEELQEAGYVYSIERADSFILSYNLTNTYEKTVQMKTKEKTVQMEQTLLNAHEYTPEFRVIWNRTKGIVNLERGIKRIMEPLIGKLEPGDMNDDVITYIEVKPAWDQNNMTRLFKINQKWMWEKYRIYVNLVEPCNLFEKTFTPEKWLTTPTGKKRAINWPVISLEQWLETL